MLSNYTSKNGISGKKGTMIVTTIYLRNISTKLIFYFGV